MSLALLLIALAAADSSADRLTRPIARGELLSVQDFQPGAPSPGALDAAAAAGHETRRALAVGSVVRAADIVPPRLVRRGDSVTIRVRRGAMVITTAGKALGDASFGDNLRVVAAASHRTLDARASGPATVDVTIP